MILFFGPAGAGKSVQGQMLASEKGWDWISSGDLLRDTKDPAIHAEIEKGNLIPSETMYHLFADALAPPTDPARVILDGFPRKREQAEWLVNHLPEHAKSIGMAIVLVVQRQQLLERIAARGRADDTAEAVDERLRIYDAEVNPILDYLTEQGVPIAHIDGVGEEKDIHQLIMQAVASANIV